MSLAKHRVTFNLSANVVLIIDDDRDDFEAHVWRDARNGMEWTLSAARRCMEERAAIESGSPAGVTNSEDEITKL